MAKKAVSAQIYVLRALSEWPKDNVRPTIQFQDVLRNRFEQDKFGMSEAEQLKQANALYSLLENRYKIRYPVTGTLLRPKSNPTHFTDLVQEMEEAPNRSWLQRMLLKAKGVVRLQ